jgi:pentapeptide MXKDX repeat protein
LQIPSKQLLKSYPTSVSACSVAEAGDPAVGNEIKLFLSSSWMLRHNKLECLSCLKVEPSGASLAINRKGWIWFQVTNDLAYYAVAPTTMTKRFYSMSFRQKTLGRQALGRQALGWQALGWQALGRQALGQQALGRQTFGWLTFGRQCLVDKATANSVDQMSVDQMSVDQMSVNQMSVDQMSGDRMVFDDKFHDIGPWFSMMEQVAGFVSGSGLGSIFVLSSCKATT